MSCPHGEWREDDCDVCQQLNAKDAEIARLREDAESAARKMFNELVKEEI